MISIPSDKPAQEKNQSPESTGEMGITLDKRLLGQIYPELADKLTKVYGFGAHCIILNRNDGADSFPETVEAVAHMAHHSGKLDTGHHLWKEIHDHGGTAFDALTIVEDFLKDLGVQDPYLPSSQRQLEELQSSDDASPERKRPPDTEKLANWMTANSFATGHGHSVEDLLSELKWQVDEIRAKRQPATNIQELIETSEVICKKIEDECPMYWKTLSEVNSNLRSALVKCKGETE